MHCFRLRASPELPSERRYDPLMGRDSRRTLILVLCGLSLAGCGDDDPGLPAACTRGPHAVRRALRLAPSPVRIDGVPISRCVSDASDAGELQATGTSLVGAAAELGATARRDPGGAAELRLGYLIGAARRGAQPASGERTELLRRLDQETQGLRGGRTALRRGLEAGRRGG
jgi:hypothetical protein